MSTPSLSDQPIAELEAWHPVRDTHGYRLVGVVTGTPTVRITSPLREFDLSTAQALTESGRVYRLIGDADPEAVARMMKKLYGQVALDAGVAALADPAEVVAHLGEINGAGLRLRH